jgi:hypothetical protein
VFLRTERAFISIENYIQIPLTLINVLATVNKPVSVFQRFYASDSPDSLLREKPVFVDVLHSLGKYMRKPLPDPWKQGPFSPLFPLNLVGFCEVPGKHLLHFDGKLATQDNGIHLVIAFHC